MTDILLSKSLGHDTADATLRETITLYESTFPGQITAYYVEGSYADSSYLPTSDIDITIIFSSPFSHEETKKTAEALWETTPHKSTMEVDLTIIDTAQLQTGVHPALKLGTHCIYGQDICRDYPIVPLDAWTRERMHAAYWLLINVYNRPTPLPLMLDFPDAKDEFYGYMNRMLHLPDGRDVPCSRNIVRTTGWAATALLAWQAGKYVGRKRDCAQLYRQRIGDEWASLLEEITDFCQIRFQYHTPEEQSARLHLRALCEQIRNFEQHFVAQYKMFVLEQLHSGEPEQIRFATWVQGLAPLDDEEVKFALKNSGMGTSA